MGYEWDIAQMGTMVLEYLPTFTQTKSPSFVGQNTSTMVSINGIVVGVPSDKLTSPWKDPPFSKAILT